MQAFAKAAFGAALLGIACSPSHADTIRSLGFFSGASSLSTGFMENVTAGSFTDYFLFRLTEPSAISTYVASSFTNPTQEINGLNLALFSLGNRQTPLATAPATYSSFSPTSGFALANFGIDEGPGNYFLAVSGNAGGPGSFEGNLAFSVSPVPLPASLPLFGAALLGIGAYGVFLNCRNRDGSALEAIGA